MHALAPFSPLRALAFTLALTGAADAQDAVLRVVEPGSSAAARTAVRIISSHRHVIPPGNSLFVLARDSTYRGTVVVLGRDAAVAAAVTGDVVVVGGDLFLRPGADISGRAVAVGGGVYESSLARVAGGTLAYRRFTYDIEPSGTRFLLRYRSLDDPLPLLEWPGLYGIRALAYDRSDGLSVPVAPRLNLGPVTVDPRLTPRSQLGTIDPWADAVVRLPSAAVVRVTGGRGTFSNEGWFWNDLLNSTATLWGGDDARNYYRATRVEATVSRRWDRRSSGVEPFAGVRWERDRSVRPGAGALGGPWSVLGGGDVDDMLRPNPLIDDGDITSAVAGVHGTWARHAASAAFRLDAEAGRLVPAPGVTVSSFNFAQVTWDGALDLPTTGAHHLSADAHAVLPLSRTTPRQRWAYLGGPGTIPTLPLLALGGDRLLFLAAQYTMPLQHWRLSVLGSPAIALRGVLARADAGRWPAFARALGLRLILNAAYVEYMADPALRHGSIGLGVRMP